MLRDVDLASPGSVEDPAEYFAAAMETGPVQWSDAHRGWVVLSHAEVEAAFRDDKTLSADRSRSFRRSVEGKGESLERAAELLTTWMNFRDAPEHTRLRQPVKGAFTPRRVNALDSAIQSVVDEVIARFEGQTVELTNDFARPVPALVIAEILGVDREHRERFQAWSHDLAQLVFATQPGVTPDPSVGQASDEFIAFFRRLVEEERKHPSDSLLSTIVHDTGTGLSELELIGTCTLLLFAGHETTQTLIANAMGMLLERDDLVAQMRHDPAIDETAVDEFMRVVGPARSMIRKVAIDHERGGQHLKKGQTVYLAIAAANHDRSVFPDPGTVDLWRDPNPHLGFGWGPHYCLGANLARLEARIAIRTLLDRFSEITPAGSLTPLHGGVVGFGRRPLRVHLTA